MEIALTIVAGAAYYGAFGMYLAVLMLVPAAIISFIIDVGSRSERTPAKPQTPPDDIIGREARV